MADLQKKIDFAIHLLQAAEKKAAEVGQPVEICYSGGKDSDVILELARMSGINYRAIYKNTTIDPPGTIKHALDNGVEVMRPKESFLSLISRKGFPTRNHRFCCEILKEYKILDYAVVGVRKDESKSRTERYKEPEQCREYSATEKAKLYYPLLDWTKKDIVQFINERDIKCHPLYYDERGKFHVERRLGCVGCPLAYVKRRQQEFRQYPGLVKLYVRGGAEIHRIASQLGIRREHPRCLRVFRAASVLRQHRRLRSAVWLARPVRAACRLQESFRRPLRD